MSQALTALDNGNMAPNESMRNGYLAKCADLKTAITSWRTINTVDLPAFNAILTRNNAKLVAPSSRVLVVPVCT